MARKLRDFQPFRCYHLMSRIAHQEYYLSQEEKSHLVRLFRRVERFSSVLILAYCVMSNHFHLLVYLPERPKDLPTVPDLIGRIAALYGEAYARCVLGEWERLESLQEGLSLKERMSFFARMYDVSEFMKSIKQRYSMSFNYENEHFGTMWEGRFKSVCVQATQGAMCSVAAYDDLNPIRAGIVKDLAEYPWCSWYAALHGDEIAQDAYRFIYGMEGCEWNLVASLHLAVMKEKAAYFQRASRSFIEGGALGDDDFIREYAKAYFKKERKTGPIKIIGGQQVWGDLRVAREVREKVSMDFIGEEPPLPDNDPKVMGIGSDPIPMPVVGEGDFVKSVAANSLNTGIGSDPIPVSGDVVAGREENMGKGSDPIPVRRGDVGIGSDPMPVSVI